ncbi:MAG: DUF255 domain-containing protein [Gammaproteobacteria bacterium]
MSRPGSVFRVIALLVVTAAPLYSVQATEGVEWHLWEKETFNKARAENKLLFIDVGTQWCTACKWMHTITLRHPEVIRRLNRDFVSISIDADAQPDLGERYAAWGWPALIFLRPDGSQVKALKGNRTPENFIPLIDQLKKAHLQQSLTASDPFPEKNSGDGRSLEQLLQAASQQLDNHYDQGNGGWGGQVKGPQPAAIEYAFRRSNRSGDPLWQERALQTLLRINDLMDPVWGGVAAASTTADNPDNWKPGVIPEKRTRLQAGTLLNYAEAYHATGDPQWFAQAQRIIEYLKEFMLAPQGAYYASQDSSPITDYIPDAAEVRKGYYALNDPQRRQQGLPAVDKTIYADINARLVKALVKLYEASGEQRYLDMATKNANYLISAHLLPDGWFAQTTQDPPPRYGERGADRLRKLPIRQKLYLRTQAQMGNALLSLYRADNNPRWVALAQRLADATVSYLLDLEKGGFYSTPLTDIQLGNKSADYKPFIDNAVMAGFLLDLSHYREQSELPAIARQALRVIGAQESLDYEGRFVGEYLLALDKAVNGNLLISIVTSELNEQVSALHQAALKLYEPAKIIRLETPGRHPDRDQTALYACQESLCTHPIKDPQQVANEIGKFRKKLRLSRLSG